MTLHRDKMRLLPAFALRQDHNYCASGFPDHDGMALNGQVEPSLLRARWAPTVTLISGVSLSRSVDLEHLGASFHVSAV